LSQNSHHLFIGFFSAVIAITLQHNVQLPQVLMGRFRHASRAAMKLRAAFNQRKGTLAHLWKARRHREGGSGCDAHQRLAATAAQGAGRRRGA
jgi:hypothetical protein